MQKTKKKRTIKKETSKDSQGVQFTISKIELINHELKRELPEITVAFIKDLRYFLEADINLLLENSIVQVVVNYRFYTTDLTLLEMIVENDFKVIDLPNLITDGKINNLEFALFLVGTSITHSRGIQSMLIKDTTIAHLYIPPMTRERILDKISDKSPLKR